MVPGWCCVVFCARSAAADVVAHFSADFIVDFTADLAVGFTAVFNNIASTVVYLEGGSVGSILQVIFSYLFILTFS